MGITVDYTPMGAVQEAGRQAGSARGHLERAQMQQTQDRFEMTLKAQRDAREFTARMQQEAASESYERALALAQAKSQIDFESEIQMYQKRRAMMFSEIEQIQSSQILNPEEAEVLTKKAMSKMFGVVGNSTMENFYEKERAKMVVYDSLKKQVDSGAMTSEEAQEQARIHGFSYATSMFLKPEQIAAEKAEKLEQRFDRVRRQLDTYGIDKGGLFGIGKDYVTVKDKPDAKPRKATMGEIARKESLERQMAEIMEARDTLYMEATPKMSMEEQDVILAELDPVYQDLWETGKKEGISFEEFLFDIGYTKKKEPMQVPHRKNKDDVMSAWFTGGP